MQTQRFSKDSSVLFTPLYQRYHDPTLEIQAFIFAKYVALDQACCINEESHLRIERSCKDPQFSPDLSVCAVSTSTNQVLAAIKNKPFASNRKRYVQFDDYDSLLDHEKSFLDVLHHLDARWEPLFKGLGFQPSEAEFLHYVIGFTDECAMGNGLFTELWKYNEEMARKNGFKYIYSLLASKEMQGLMTRKFGFVAVEEITMADLEVDGIKVCREYIEKDPRRRDLKLQLAMKKL